MKRCYVIGKCAWLVLCLVAVANSRAMETMFTISDHKATVTDDLEAPRELWFHQVPPSEAAGSDDTSFTISSDDPVCHDSVFHNPVCQCDVPCNVACGDCDTRPYALFPPHASGWKIGGWVSAGFTTNPDNPANPPGGVGNLPSSFNYRNDEFMLNQVAAVVQRSADNGGCGWAWGGRLDLLYGEDYIFTQAAGWETRPDFTNHWNCFDGCSGIGDTARLGLAVPQIYGEVALHNFRLQVGHFYSPMGYERVAATDNFFYSRATSRQYGLPFTNSGGLLHWQATDCWSFFGGAVNGWDKLDAVSDRVAFLGGVHYRPWHERYSIALSVISGEEDGSDPPMLGRRTTYSLVFDWQVNDRWHAVVEQITGWQQNGGLPGEDGEWYSLYQYLFFDVCEDVRLGTRVGWFNDDDGARIFPGVPGHMYEATVGLNVQLTQNIVMRSEVRWNWFDVHDGIADGLGPFSGNGPPGLFGDLFNLDEQLLAAVDLVVQW